MIHLHSRYEENIEVKVELPLLSPGSGSLALDDPEVDSLEKLEEPEDVKGTSPIRSMKYFNSLYCVSLNIYLFHGICFGIKLK